MKKDIDQLLLDKGSENRKGIDVVSDHTQSYGLLSTLRLITFKTLSLNRRTDLIPKVCADTKVSGD